MQVSAADVDVDERGVTGKHCQDSQLGLTVVQLQEPSAWRRHNQVLNHFVARNVLHVGVTRTKPSSFSPVKIKRAPDSVVTTQHIPDAQNVGFEVLAVLSDI